MELTSDVDATSKAVAGPSIPQRAFAYLTDLNPTDNTKFIKARVYRKRVAMKVPSLIATGFSCILLDKKGSAIQADAYLKEKDRFDHDLQLNCVYRIQGFGFKKTDNWGKTLDNDFTLCFGKHTRTNPLTDNDFPYHYFNFAAYNELGARLEKKNPILTAHVSDYIGYVHNVEKVKEDGSAITNKIKLRNIAIRNLKNNVVLFTLWNEKADGFEEEEYARMRQPVILAVSSCYLKRYGGTYNQNNTCFPQLEVQTERLTDWEKERNRNRVPLGTLLQIDPNTQQRVLFTQDAMILRVDSAYGWYYQKCDECGGKLDYGYIHGHCHPYGTQSKPENSYSFRVVITDGTGNVTMTCFGPQTDGLIKNIDALLQEVGNKDPAIIPPQILALQNTRHVFQFRFAKPAGKGPPTLVLQKVMDHPPAILPAPAEGPSSPPGTPPTSHTLSQISPPPATPTATQDTPANMASEARSSTTSTTRKELFTMTADKENDPPGTPPTGHTLLQISPPSATPTATQDTPADMASEARPSTTSTTRKELFTTTGDKENDPEAKKQKTE
ncbi:nucleic acid-binding, OB-fold protein [Artemisia annua]|uniref:Nucleic acid-binding, OB-fold protein n=1 Tax=Artemisia annua TaxID=35608 RepID=A0A2U1L1K9_ARTAN|nr:nucleic acid-binding, OB-fold protein [Artemisia annua]